MKIWIDKNNLLVIENPNIPQTKEYTYDVGGYVFSDFDKWMIVYHKKEFKIINLKNLGDNMWVLYTWNKWDTSSKLDLEAFTSAICNYSSYDEETWKSYYFLPKINEKEIENLNNSFTKLWAKIKLEKTNKWIIVNWESTEKNENILAKFFAWTLLYGKLDIKKWELLSFKFHLPLFWAHLAQKEEIDNSIKELNKIWIFVKKDILETNDGIVYQVSGNDYEILQSFSNWHQSIEKINKIPKHDQALEIRDKLIEFIKIDSQIPSEWKDEVIETIQNSQIKILIK